jgi:nitrite reductase/ring-hydroxylating ferredoxin subunit
MPWVRIGSMKHIAPGKVSEVTVESRPYAVCNVEGEIHVVSGECPHRGGPLGQGALHGRMLVCPWHAWEFDCVSGENDRDPSIKLGKPGVKVEAGEIWMEVE